MVDKWNHPEDNRYVEITECHKSDRCIVDREILTNHKPSNEEERLKGLWDVDLVLDNSRFEKY